MSRKPRFIFWNISKAQNARVAHVQKFWFHGDIFRSVFFDALSLTIPYAEDFITKISADALPHTSGHPQRDAQLLLEEETAHAHVHRAYNEMLRSEGYRTESYERLVPLWTSFVMRHFSLGNQFAVAAAVEHLTACLGVVGLDYAVLDIGVDARMRRVWMWHLIEEVHHRHACFNLARFFGARYYMRASALIAMTIIFILIHTYTMAGLLWQSGHLFDYSVWREGVRFACGKNGAYKIIIPFFSYFKPNFHPNEIPIRSVVSEHIHQYHIESELLSYFK